MVIRAIVTPNDGTLSSSVFILPLLIAGFSFGSLIAPLFQTTLSSAPIENAGAASGALQAMQHAGSAIGVSAIGLLFFGGLTDGVGSALDYRQAMSTALLYPITCAAIVLGLAAIASRFQRNPPPTQ